MNEKSTVAASGVIAPPEATPHRRLHWWVEALITLVFYVIYSAIRNQFGSTQDTSIKQSAFDNAILVINGEKALGLYFEEWIHQKFLDWDAFIVFWNIFYGSFHFIVTIGAMVWLFLRFPRRYTYMRSALASTTSLALIGFAFFPLMPPRLLSNCASQYGACVPGYDYVDTLVHPGGLWSFESGTMESISNQYAAMPSLHVGWALWCTVALFPILQTRWARSAIVAYPVFTMFSIIVTANHYWIDALGGIAALSLGLILAVPLARLLPGPAGTIRSDVA